MGAHVRRDQLRAFWRLIRQGCSSGEAARRVGLNSESGKQWFRQAGGMPPLSLVEPVRGRALNIIEREQIWPGSTPRSRSARSLAELGRAPSTVLRELRKNMSHQQYRHWIPARVSEPSRRGSIPRIWLSCAPIRRRAGRRRRSWRAIRGCGPRSRIGFRTNTAPSRSATRLARDFPDDPEMRICHEAIDQALYVQGRGGLPRDLTTHLRTARRCVNLAAAPVNVRTAPGDGDDQPTAARGRRPGGPRALGGRPDPRASTPVSDRHPGGPGHPVRDAAAPAR